MVVPPCPLRQWRVSVRARGEVVLAPELLLVDPMAPFDFPVLLRMSRFDVAVSDAGGLDGQLERQREFGTVVPSEA